MDSGAVAMLIIGISLIIVGIIFIIFAFPKGEKKMENVPMKYYQHQRTL